MNSIQIKSIQTGTRKIAARKKPKSKKRKKLFSANRFLNGF